MTELTIRLDTIDKVKHFSHLMLLCPCEADLLAERYVINAKSIMDRTSPAAVGTQSPISSVNTPFKKQIISHFVLYHRIMPHANGIRQTTSKITRLTGASRISCLVSA